MICSSPPRHDRCPALFVIAMDLHALPHRVDVIGVAAHEGVGGGAVFGVDDEDRAAGCLAVVGYERARGHHVHVVITGLVEMDAVVAIEFRARGHAVLAVGGMDYEQHGSASRWSRIGKNSLARLAIT